MIPTSQYSPGFSDLVTDPKRLPRVMKEVFDRLNWLVAEIERMKQDTEIAASSGSSVSTPVPVIKPQPVGSDNLVTPGVQSGPIIAGADNWGFILIPLPDADYTMTLDQGQNRIFRFTGTLTALRVIALPKLHAKMWVISNAATQTLRFRVAGVTGNTTDVPSNNTAVLFCANNDIFLGARGV